MDPKTYHYYFPSYGKGEGWAEFLLCESGMVAAVSDFGNYAFAWRHRGEGTGIREFVAQIGPDYAYSKFHEGRNPYDGTKTRLAVLKLIGDSTPSSVAPQEAACLVEAIEGDFENLDDEFAFVRFQEHYEDYLHDGTLSDLCECYCTSQDQQCARFCSETLKRLQEALRKELAEERKRTAEDAFMASAYLGVEP